MSVVIGNNSAIQAESTGYIVKVERWLLILR